jgi:hypothetical protein
MTRHGPDAHRLRLLQAAFSSAGAHDACAVFRYRTDADFVSRAGNVCDLAYLVIGPC